MDQVLKVNQALLVYQVRRVDKDQVDRLDCLERRVFQEVLVSLEQLERLEPREE